MAFGRCKLTHADGTFVDSHIIPKRLRARRAEIFLSKVARPALDETTKQLVRQSTRCEEGREYSC